MPADQCAAKHTQSKRTPRDKLPRYMQGRRVLKNQYRLVSRIGQGSWAVCYKAEAVDNPNVTVAVKCIPRRGLPSRHRATISCEAAYHETISGKHENILQLLGTEEDIMDDVLYIVTDFCTKGNLSQYTERNVFCAQTDLTKLIFLQVLDGLKAMHDSGVYHRDLKPENIFIKEDGTAVIGDFGFATSKAYTKNFGMGTPGYVAPEVYGGIYRDMDAWSSRHGDIWALGIILVNMVLGRKSRLIWTDANLTDPDFHFYYYSNRDYFFDLFDISLDANDIFTSIFEVHVDDRIGLNKLRKRIEGIETFGPGSERSRQNTKVIKTSAMAFLTFGLDCDEVDITMDPCTRRSSTMLSSPKARPASRKQEAVEKVAAASFVSSADIGALPMESAEQRLQAPYQSPCLRPVEKSLEAVKPLSITPARPPRVRSVEKADKVPVLVAHPSSESGEDSDGPETPKTNAADGNVDVAIEQEVEVLDLAANAEPLVWGPTITPVEKPAANKARPVLGKMHTWMRGALRMNSIPAKELRSV